MSGGSFNYAYNKVQEFSEELDGKLHTPEYVFSDEVRVKLNTILGEAKRTAFMMKEVEWLFSGDTEEDSFLESVAEYGTRSLG